MTEPVCQNNSVGAYPGSFDPPTIAHLGIAVMARRAAELDEVHLIVSRRALGKEHADHAAFDLRIEVIEASIAHADWLKLIVTDDQLIADMAEGYAAIIMGADKWQQVNDPQFYGGDTKARDAAVARLPQIVGPARAGSDPLPDDAIVIDLPAKLRDVSSSGARAGRSDWMTPPARKTAVARGIWGL